MSSPRLSDRELARINAAAVTREYNVKPHLGEPLKHPYLQDRLNGLQDYRTVSAVNGYVGIYMCLHFYSH